MALLLPAFSPWSLGRAAAAGRRGVLLFVLTALVLGFGMHAARACVADASAGAVVFAGEASPCHDDEVDPAEAACEAHCRTDAQPGRSGSSIDVPDCAMVDLARPRALMPRDPIAQAAPVAPCPAAGRPLHLLLVRQLR